MKVRKTMSPSKVMLIMPSFRGGGAERVFIDLAVGLNDKALNVELVVLSNDGPYFKSIPDNLKVTVLDSGSVRKSYRPIKEHIQRSKPDVIVSCMTHLNVGVALAKFFSRSKAKLILTEHNPFSSEKASMPMISRWIFSTLVQLSYSFADKIVMVSKGIENDFKKIFHINGKKITTIYNPIDITRVRKLSKEAPLAVSSKPMLVTMGRLVPQKRFDVLINAFNIVVETLPEASLHILGSGPLEEDLKKQIASKSLDNNVFLEGFKDNPFGLLGQSDLFVLSSDFEGFGNVIVEALSLGLNVVSTDCPTGPVEILEHGEYGFLVPVGSEKKLAETMIYALENRKSAEILIDRALDFDMSIAVDKYHNLIGSLLK